MSGVEPTARDAELAILAEAFSARTAAATAKYQAQVAEKRANHVENAVDMAAKLAEVLRTSRPFPKVTVSLGKVRVLAVTPVSPSEQAALDLAARLRLNNIVGKIDDVNVHTRMCWLIAPLRMLRASRFVSAFITLRVATAQWSGDTTTDAIIAAVAAVLELIDGSSQQTQKALDARMAKLYALMMAIDRSTMFQLVMAEPKLFEDACASEALTVLLTCLSAFPTVPHALHVQPVSCFPYPESQVHLDELFAEWHSRVYELSVVGDLRREFITYELLCYECLTCKKQWCKFGHEEQWKVPKALIASGQDVYACLADRFSSLIGSKLEDFCCTIAGANGEACAGKTHARVKGALVGPLPLSIIVYVVRNGEDSARGRGGSGAKIPV